MKDFLAVMTPASNARKAQQRVKDAKASVDSASSISTVGLSPVNALVGREEATVSISTVFLSSSRSARANR